MVAEAICLREAATGNTGVLGASTWYFMGGGENLPPFTGAMAPQLRITALGKSYTYKLIVRA